MTKFLNISTDTTLGGNSPSDETVSSQKALKTYIDANAGGASDGTTINKNSSNQLQAIGVINKNTTVGATNPKYDWVGTLQEYEDQNVETLHPDWICYITDDVSGGTSVYTKTQVNTLLATKANSADVTNAITAMLEGLYPVGSVYIGTTSTCPIASLISGSTWTLISSDRVLQGASSSHNAGTTIEAGLPDITGTVLGGGNGNNSGYFTGAFRRTGNGPSKTNGASGGEWQSETADFNASRSSSIYGNSTTVQPPAYVVNIWQRTA